MPISLMLAAPRLPLHRWWERQLLRDMRTIITVMLVMPTDGLPRLVATSSGFTVLEQVQTEPRRASFLEADTAELKHLMHRPEALRLPPPVELTQGANEDIVYETHGCLRVCMYTHACVRASVRVRGGVLLFILFLLLCPPIRPLIPAASPSFPPLKPPRIRRNCSSLHLSLFLLPFCVLGHNGISYGADRASDGYASLPAGKKKSL
eukprot:GHVU01105675.1.p1 GENE.GHVU01105675.1~~GHVU01105675.1.p1  ORF type:complete len:207 (+),score=17.80 GHVU01105675.1:329-949(+)